ncbi:hypothetical protein [Conexibacter sp. SYSU D00693]|uniref:hypothetical protein n=1 Tax=Conexibacter sp. SYSU D00693 TaxID=2812560 RepID=UPI00196B4281|nr:hypothetical protein [Conexibacter sp. SYSU D00693]
MSARPRLAALELAEDPDAFAALGFTVEDGVCLVAGTELRLAGGGGGITGWELGDGPVHGARHRAHPNGVVLVDHVVLRTPDLQRDVAALEARGLELRRTRDVETTTGTLRQAFLPLADALVEVVGPVEPTGGGPLTFWGVTLVTQDLDATAALLGDRLGPVRDAVQPGRRIATVRAEAAGVRTPLALMTRR